MNNLPIFDIPKTLTFFDAIISRDICFVYGLNTASTNVTIEKYAVGQYANKCCNYFFTFKDSTGRQVYPFNVDYSTNPKQINLYYYYRTENSTINYYNAEKASDVLNFNDVSLYLNENAIQTSGALSGYNKGTSSIAIKDLFNNNVQFPCSTFIINNLKDYKITAITPNLLKSITTYNALTGNVYQQKYIVDKEINKYYFNINTDKKIDIPNAKKENITILTYNTLSSTNNYSTSSTCQKDLSDALSTLNLTLSAFDVVLSTVLSGIYK